MLHDPNIFFLNLTPILQKVLLWGRFLPQNALVHFDLLIDYLKNMALIVGTMIVSLSID